MSPRILNDPPLPPGPENAAEVAQALAERMLAALGAATDGSGRVNYPRLAASGAFAEAIEAARRLGSISLATLEARASKLAFWINVYNALVLHGIVALGVRRSVARVWNFFGRARYRIDGLVFSVDAIEHGVLRGNRRRKVLPSRPFGRRDPRRRHALEPPDPRMHFAITCGARSCPTVGIYRAAAIDAQLELATKGFVNQEVTVERGRLVCSRVFKWYRHDFDAVGGLGAFLLRYLDDGPVRQALVSGATPCAAFSAYDWSLQHPAHR